MQAGLMRALNWVMAALLSVMLVPAGALCGAREAFAQEGSPGGGALAASGLEAVGAQAGELEAQAATADSSWYTGKSSPYTISNLNQLRAFSELVNSGQDSFANKEVRLGGNVIMATGDAIDPIGTSEHPFEGMFNGRSDSTVSTQSIVQRVIAQVEGPQIMGVKVNVGSRLSNIGLFGYAGDNATIKNLTLAGGEIAVSNSASGKVISDVGAVAGHLGGSIENCYSSASVTITNNGAVSSTKGKTEDGLCTIVRVGGLVGSLGGDIKDCVHTQDATITITSKSNVSENVPNIAGAVGGLVGEQGDINDASKVPTATGCVNEAGMEFNVSGKGGVDRFKQQMYSKSIMVGGIVGYTMGNVSQCSNTAAIHTGIMSGGKVQSGWGASTTGGIVGSLRGPTIVQASEEVATGASDNDPGYAVWKKSEGTGGPATVSIEKCSNTGNVVGLSSVGGICGSAGAFTKISGCSNTGQITGARWNKPCPAGIVGITNGDIAYCYSTGRIESVTGGGYYASGVTGLLTTYNTSSTDAKLIMNAPQIYGCYVTGAIVSKSSGYRAAVIAGESDGYIHDNCFTPNLVTDKSVPEEWAEVLEKISDAGVIEKEDDVAEVQELVSRVNTLDGTKFSVARPSGQWVLRDGSGKQAGAKASLQQHCQRSQLVDKDQNRGGLSNNHELTEAELKGSKGRAYLNRVVGSNNSWEDLNRVAGSNDNRETYYVPNSSTNGFPLLNWQSGAVVSGTTDLASAANLTVALADGGNPQYSASTDPVPELDVTLNGTTLRQNADYRVIPQSGAKAVGSGYKAQIEGIGEYKGTPSNEVPYSIEQCAISKCKVTAASATFNWEAQKPSWVKVIDDAGNEVPSGDYTWDTLPNADGSTKAVNGKYYDYINVHYASYRYDIKVTAKDTSTNYTGETTQPAFHISWASLNYDPKNTTKEKDETAKYDKVVWKGQSWDFAKALETKGYVKIKYTGSAIQPTINNPTYKDRTLRNGTGKQYWNSPLDYDYRYVYGNPNPETSSSNGFDQVNVTGSNENDLACMTIRFTSGSNFDNYTNVFFEITPADIASDVTVSGLASAYAYNKSAIRPAPKLTYNGKTLVEGTDYTVTYANNTQLGKASITLTGKGNYTGKTTREFSIVKGNLAGASVSVPGQTYTGKALAPAPAVTCDGVALVEGADYALSYADNVNAGTGSVTVTGIGNYEGSTVATFPIAKAAQTLKASSKTKKLKAAKLAKKAQKLKAAKLAKVSGAKTKVTYSGKASKKKARKYFSVSKKGVITVKKGTPKGTYKVKMTAKAASSGNYLAGKKSFTITVKVK